MAGNVRKGWLVLMILGFLAACGSPEPTSIEASASTNGGVIPITQAGTYRYAVSDECGIGSTLRLTSDTGAVDYLGATGTLYLTAGNWTGVGGFKFPLSPNGQPFEACLNAQNWHLRLTPST
jgi:hypothetical protein